MLCGAVWKTWAEVLEGGLKMLWPMMDDRQKLKYVRYAHKFVGKTTSDGVRMTWQRFGEAVGTTRDGRACGICFPRAGEAQGHADDQAVAADTPGVDELDLDLLLPCGTDPEALSWAGSSGGALEMKLALAEVNNADLLYLVGCTLAKTPGKDNWVDKAGGLPEYICRIARSIAAKRGKSISNAIQIAVGVVKRWAKGLGDVDTDTRAKAAAAVASWEAKKAKARAT